MPRQKKQVLKQRKDGRYCSRYHGLQFMGRTAEEALAAREEYKREEGRGDIRQYYGPTVEEYAAQWLKRAKTGTALKTRQECSAFLEKLTKHLGDRRFPDIRPSDIKTVYSTEFDGLSDGYIRRAASVYRSLFTAATEDGYCSSNPAAATSAKPHKGERLTGHRAITQQERTWINTLCTDHRAHAAVITMLYSGLRPQEAKALDITRDVDFERQIITVRESVHLDGWNSYSTSAELKTSYSKREIPLLPPVAAALRGKSGPLITKADGGPVTPIGWASLWESYVHCMETEINHCRRLWYGRKLEHQGKELPPFVRFTVTPYDLRHSFCTMCRDASVEINTCIHWMGHKDATMILRIYDEYTPERGRAEAEKLSIRMQNDMQF